MSDNPWQIKLNAYNHHSPVHSSTDLVPLTDHWKLRSLESETQTCGFCSLTSRCRKTMTSVFSSVKTLTGQSGASKIRPLCYPNFNNWTVIGNNNSVDSVKNPYKLHSQEWKIFCGEFDPGSGWTLAACLIHASRTRCFCSNTRVS